MPAFCSSKFQIWCWCCLIRWCFIVKYSTYKIKNRTYCLWFKSTGFTVTSCLMILPAAIVAVAVHDACHVLYWSGTILHFWDASETHLHLTCSKLAHWLQRPHTAVCVNFQATAAAVAAATLQLFIIVYFFCSPLFSGLQKVNATCHCFSRCQLWRPFLLKTCFQKLFSLIVKSPKKSIFGQRSWPFQPVACSTLKTHLVAIVSIPASGSKLKGAASVFYLLIHGTGTLYWSPGWKYTGENGPVRGMLNRIKPTGGFLYPLTRFGFSWWWWERVCRSVYDAVASLPGGGAAADCIFRKGNEHILWANHVRRSAFVWVDYCDRGYFYTASMWEGLFFLSPFFLGHTRCQFSLEAAGGSRFFRHGAEPYSSASTSPAVQKFMFWHFLWTQRQI